MGNVVWPPGVTFFAVLSLYVLTMYPDVTGGDAPELVSAAVLGGVPHPPGYPTFCLVSQLFAQLPVGNIARRINLSTALLGAAAAALLHASVQLRTGCSASGAAAAALFALSPLQWRYSVQADVFGLSNFFAAAILLATTHNLRVRSLCASALTAVVCGLSLTNQHTAIFLVVPVAVTILAAGYDAGSSGRWGLVGGLSRSLLLLSCGAVGLLPYLYLPIAARRGALVSWGDCSTIKGFIRHITRAEYGSQLWCPFGGDVYCLSLQLFASQHFDKHQILLTAWLSICASGAAWAQDLHLHSMCLIFPLIIAACIALMLGLFPCRMPTSRNTHPDNRQPCIDSKDASATPTEEMRREGKKERRWAGRRMDSVVLAALMFYLVIFHALAHIPHSVSDLDLYREVLPASLPAQATLPEPENTR